MKSTFVILLPVLALSVSSIRGAEVDFERDIRPILAEKCLLCHGPDDEKGGLRLTGLDFATKKLESGDVAIVPGQPETSTLVARIHTSDPDDIMPPPDKAEPLTAGEKAKLKQWISEGAEWPKHWAFEELRTGEPSTANGGEHPIDIFVRRTLKEHGIEPSPEADPVTLIRRLYYDLIGLPPTPEKVDGFVAAYQKSKAEDRAAVVSRLVDELLASKHFGERWGRHWLDIARYADSDGYEKDNNRPDAWKYRDWVIDAINADMPFDQFTIEQFAGDLLENPTPDQLLATAFNRQTLTNTEGGTDQEQWRVAAVMDRLETTGAAWLGLTLTCARCHTHKYDEITHKEYYQLFAYLNNGDEVTAKVPKSREAWTEYEEAAAKHRADLDALRKQVGQARKDLGGRLPDWENRAQAWLAAAEKAGEPKFAPVVLDELSGPKGVTFTKNKDDSVLVGGENPNTATYTIIGKLPAGKITGIRLEVLPDDKLPAKGPGRVKHGNFVLNHIRLSIQGKPQIFAAAEADHSQPDWHVSEALDPNLTAKEKGSGWAVGNEYGKPHHADFGLAEPVELKDAAKFSLQLIQTYSEQHTIGKFRITALTTPTRLAVPEKLRPVLAKPADKRSKEEQTLLARHFERVDPETAPLLASLDALESKIPAKPEMDVRILRERTGDGRRATHIFRRGEFKQPIDEVRAGTLSTLPPVRHRGENGDRLDLANWLVSGENPLPPRVVANQIWTNLFGAGLVTTLNDFGVRGDRPSHPELLDWIAAEFVRNGWSRKQLIKTIVLSKTYRQSSNHRPELAEIDPKNRLLARQNRFRVEAEIVRDISLAAAGLLSDKTGGPSVFPPIPSGVADVNYNSAFKWKVSPGEDKYRRGMYTFFKRTAPHPNLMTFDCPDSNVTCIQRTRSNTPLAALITLNNETFAEAARALAKQVVTEMPDATDGEKIDQAFRQCVSRTPEPAERDRLASLLETSRSWYRQHPEDAKTFIADTAPDGVPAEEAASWAATLRVILNLDEFITRS